MGRRTAAELANGSRITDYIGLGAMAKVFAREKALERLAAAGARTKRQAGKWPKKKARLKDNARVRYSIRIVKRTVLG